LDAKNIEPAQIPNDQRDTPVVDQRIQLAGGLGARGRAETQASRVIKRRLSDPYYWAGFTLTGA
jgi:CHAT domain-containing protein